MDNDAQGLAGRDVRVLKSTMKAATYVYLPLDGDYEDLPVALKRLFGRAEFVMEFHLSAERKLGRADARAVLAALTRQGFYLQLPPTVEELDRRG